MVVIDVVLIVPTLFKKPHLLSRADRARKGLFSAVRAHVRRQIRRLRKGLVARVAAIGSLARVRAQVCLERGRARVGFAANAANVDA